MYHYTYHTEKKTWYEALRECKLKGGNLASITSKEEQVKIVSGMPNWSDGGWWIGLHSDRTWRWVDGRTLAWANWFPGGPKDSTGCAGMQIRDSDKQCEWFDKECDAEYKYICKFQSKHGFFIIS